MRTYNFLNNLIENSLSFINSNLSIFRDSFNCQLSLWDGLIHFTIATNETLLLHGHRWVKSACIVHQLNVAEPW